MEEKLLSIVKFLGKEANASELSELEKDIKSKSFTKVFDQMVKLHYLVGLSMKKYNVEEAKHAVGKKIKRDIVKGQINRLKKTAFAAAAVLLIAVILIKQQDNKAASATTVIPAHKIQAGTDKAILTLSNGDEIVMEKGETYQSTEAKGNGQELVYNKKKNSEPVYHFLSIPRGGQFFLKLSDGTQVWLNSDSKLKYPTSFPNEGSRKVELLRGEAFFKVAPSSLHGGLPFSVITKEQEINVLGTEFNLRAYEDENNISTTLVEGSVIISNKKSSEKNELKPGQQARMERGSATIDVFEVDVLEETAWIKGLFYFDEKSLEKIMTDLERWYDAKAIFESSEHKKYAFTGILERTKTIEQILDHISASSNGKINFELKENIIIVK